MASPGRNDFGDLDEIDVEAIGEPGHRTFRILAEQRGQTASLWVEKEQLQALALLLEQQIVRSQRGRASGERALLTLAARFPPQASVDFKVGRLAVGYDETARRFVFTAHAIEDPESQIPQFTGAAAPSQVRALTAKIAEVVAAGRPRCPLCGAPIEGKHVCPASNGHATH
jgi:uncharacterized repeat protein (TIGR03847 family)